MEPKLQEVSEQQKATWNKFSSGWKKWDDFTMRFLKPAGDEIIRQLQPRDGEVVLDVAAGTGEPGLTIASLIPNGRVVITDLAGDMLEVARENAARRNLRNVEFRVCDVSELPFADGTFDAISCRMGFMFFPDMKLAARELWRVLKPGGRLATSVWAAPEDNAWATTIMATINRQLDLPPPPAGAPGLFRCAKPGLMADVLRDAGFQQIREESVAGITDFQTRDTYWDFNNEVAAPVVSAMSKANEEQQASIRREVYDLVQQQNPDGGARLSNRSLVLYGEKAAG